MAKRRRALRAVLLARVSTHARTQDASNPRQISDLRDVARRKGWTVVATLADRVSGAETGPGLREAISMICEKGTADLLVVTAIDRLGRDVREMLANVDKIRQYSGHFFVRDDLIDTDSPDGRMQFTLLATLAEFQRRSNRFKVIAGLEHARKKGVKLGRPRTIGRLTLARAIELRRKRPHPTWREVTLALEAEKFGRFKVTTVATAATRAMEALRKTTPLARPKKARR